LLLRSENMPCSPEAKWVLCSRHNFQSSPVAQAPVRHITVMTSAVLKTRERMAGTSCEVNRDPLRYPSVMIRVALEIVNFHLGRSRAPTRRAATARVATVAPARAILLPCDGATTEASWARIMATTTPERAALLAETHWLAEHLSDRDLCCVDIRGSIKP